MNNWSQVKGVQSGILLEPIRTLIVISDFRLEKNYKKS